MDRKIWINDPRGIRVVPNFSYFFLILLLILPVSAIAINFVMGDSFSTAKYKIYRFLSKEYANVYVCTRQYSIYKLERERIYIR